MKVKVIFPKLGYGLPQTLPNEIVFQTEVLPRAGEKFLWPDGATSLVFDILEVFHKATPQNTLDLEIVLGKTNEHKASR
jgi:hypothetical protein